MVCIGFGQGISPIVSICWGAKEKETATKIRSSFFVAGKRYAEIFGCSNSIADMVATGFRIYTITFLAMGYDVTGSMYFTSCGDAKHLDISPADYRRSSEQMVEDSSFSHGDTGRSG